MPTQTSPLQGYTGPDLVDFAANDNAIQVASTTEIVSRRELANVDLADVYEIPVEDGYIRFGHYEGTGPAYTTQEIQKVSGNAVDSNQSIIKRSTVKQPYNTSVDSQTGKMTVSGTPKSGSFAQNAAYFLTEVNQAVLATQVGIALGKGFDSILYNANPDFWDSHGMSSLNPETWAGITAGDTSFGATLFNMIFGIDPATGNGQAYVDADAFAYLADYMSTIGIFSSAGQTTTDSTYPSGYSQNYYYGSWGQPIYTSNGVISALYEDNFNYYELTVSGNAIMGFVNRSTYNYHGQTEIPSGTQASFNILCFSYEPTTVIEDILVTPKNGSSSYHRRSNYSLSNAITAHGITTYQSRNSLEQIYANGKPIVFSNPCNFINQSYNIQNANSDIAVFLNRGTTTTGGIEGITDQSGATNPDTSTWTSPQATDASLRQQYPDMYTNAIKYDVPDANGNLVEKTYIPVSWPNTASNPWTDLQPTSDTSVQTQTSTMVDMLTGIQSMIDTLTTTLTQPVNTSQTGNLPPAENPTDTGSGSSPVPATPTGSSSKLWSVYHPTQAQVDAFGAWLWSTNFVDQLLKMFQNPMEGIISLHKVFATPVDAGTGNIIVGTLDSGVSSATVTQQYVYVSCGSVSCSEDFGNVFDYNPYTHVSLYLPFIGIVPLDVSDVMRSTIEVTYGVDMFTGACLAMVEVTRDNDTVNMYQYAGSASVEYPLSNIQQSQLLSGILAVAAGGAAIATGGMSIAAGAAVAGGVANTMKSNVGRSGGFSGNAGAMGIKKPYLILQRPQTKVADLFPRLAGYPTNISGQLSDFSGQVKVTDVHVEGIPATDVELTQIEELLHSGVLV